MIYIDFNLMYMFVFVVVFSAENKDIFSLVSNLLKKRVWGVIRTLGPILHSSAAHVSSL